MGLHDPNFLLTLLCSSAYPLLGDPTVDELQFSLIGPGIFLWGVSSDPKELFTPTNRLELFCSGLHQGGGFTRKEFTMVMPADMDVPIVPASMRLFYGQFGTKKPTLKKFSVPGLEINDFTLARSILFTSLDAREGREFRPGDSFEFLRLCLRLAYALAARQRFLPFSRDGMSCYVSNIDITDDYDLFHRLVRKAPLSLFGETNWGMEDAVRELIDHFVNSIVMEAVVKANIRIKVETNTDRWLKGLLGGTGDVNREIDLGLAQWSTARKSSYSPEYNMLFKLDEPDESRGEWLDGFWRSSSDSGPMKGSA